jgi:hypothetical protein
MSFVFNRVPGWVWVAIVFLVSLYVAPDARQAIGRIFEETPQTSPAPEQPDYIDKHYGGWVYFSSWEKATMLCASRIFTLTGNANYGFACEWKGK